MASKRRPPRRGATADAVPEGKRARPLGPSTPGPSAPSPSTAAKRSDRAPRRRRSDPEGESPLVDAFAALVHELRTPVTGVIGASELLETTELDGIQQRYVQILRSSATALLDQVNNLLDLRRAERAELAVTRDTFYLYEILESVFEVVTDQAASASVTLLYEVGDDVPTYLLGDASRVRQVLLNLVANAVKFAPGHPVTVVARVVRREGDHIQLELAVEDQGPGVPEQSRAGLFQPFWQLEGSAQQKKGTGLGLAVCARVAEGLSGTLRYEDRPGGGARFVLEVPLDVQTEPDRRTLALPLAILRREVFVLRERELLGRQLVDLVQGFGIDSRAGTSLDDASPHSIVVADDPAVVTAALERGLRSVGIADGATAHRFPREAPLLIRPVRRLDLLAAVVTAAGDDSALGATTLSGEGDAGDVLVVDPSEETRALCAAILERAGYEVDAVASEEEAIDKFETKPYVAALINAELAAPASSTLLWQFRRLSDVRGVKTAMLALAPGASPQQMKRCLAIGFHGHVSTPVTAKLLEPALDAAIARLEAKPEPPRARRSQTAVHHLISDAGSAPVVTAHDEPAVERPSGPVVPAESRPPIPTPTPIDADDLEEEVSTFVSKRARDVARIRRAIEKVDMDSVRTLATTMAETAAADGYPAVCDAARALAKAARRGDVDDVEDAADAVHLAVARLSK